MHPRNPYQTPPDFKELALKYPEFRKHARQVIFNVFPANLEKSMFLLAYN